MLPSIASINPKTAHSSFTLNTPTNSASTASFAQQLAAALKSYLGSSGTASNLQVNIQATGSQSSGNRQFLVTVTNPETTVPSTQSSTPQPVTPPSTAIKPAITAAVIPSTTPAMPPATEEDAYWAMQPPAVQACELFRMKPNEGS